MFSFFAFAPEKGAFELKQTGVGQGFQPLQPSPLGTARNTHAQPSAPVCIVSTCYAVGQKKPSFGIFLQNQWRAEKALKAINFIKKRQQKRLKRKKDIFSTNVENLSIFKICAFVLLLGFTCISIMLIKKKYIF